MRNINFMVILIPLLCISPSFATWDNAEMDNGINPGSEIRVSGLCLNPSNNYSEIVYADVDTSSNPDECRVRWIYYNGSSWSAPSNMYNGNQMFTYLDYAVDSSNNPHICAYNENGQELWYFYKSEGNWYSTVADNGVRTLDKTDHDVGQYCSICVDSNGYAYIAYYDATDHSLNYATNLGGSWNHYQVEYISGVDLGKYTSIDTDSHNYPRISYYVAGNDKNLRFAYYDGNWECGDVDSSGEVGEWSSLKIDDNGNDHISYYDRSNGNLKYAVDNGIANWITSTPVSADNVGGYSSLDFIDGRNPEIAFYDFTNQDLMFTSYYSGSWHTDRIVEHTVYYPDAGLNPSLAVKSDNGYPRISYSRMYYADDHWDLWYIQYTARGPELVKAEIKDAKRASFTLNKIYPSPASSSTNISLSVSSAGYAQLNVYDLSGKLVMTSSRDVQPGESTFSMDVSHLSSGVYTLTASNGAITQTKSLIVSR